MHRFSPLAVAVLVLVLNGGAASAQSEVPEASRACSMYEAAFRAVEPHFAARPGLRRERRFAYDVYGAPRLRLAGDRPGPGSDLRACPDLQQLVSAAGLRFVGRPFLGVRSVSSPPYEHFSRPVRRDGKVYLTYWLTDEREGIDLELTPAGGGWTVEKSAYWAEEGFWDVAD